MSPPPAPRLLLVFAGCLAFWFLLSGHFAPIDVLFAVAACAAVAWVNRRDEALSEVLAWTPRLLAYAPWLLREIWIANIQVVKLVLDPRLPIDPVVVRLPTRYATDLARTTLANSITLTPGTVTIDVDGETLVVHAITRAGAEDLAAGAMARRVGRVFGDPGAP
jgi:multicomponent Na+:H+ antiporter subunit E